MSKFSVKRILTDSPNRHLQSKPFCIAQYQVLDLATFRPSRIVDLDELPTHVNQGAGRRSWRFADLLDGDGGHVLL